MKIAIIPARGGSRRIPRKNIRPFFGKPIMAYSIETAKRSGLFDAVYVSTEDPEIAEVAHNNGAFVIPRPMNLAEMNGAPDCGTQEVTRHAIVTLLAQGLEVEYACCIYPCAPMLDAFDLKAGFDWLVNPLGPTSPFTFVKGIYYWGHATKFLDRTSVAFGFEMVKNEENHIDIDTRDDWKRAEEAYARIYQHAYMEKVELA